ncbi:AbrB family transcriptional regulator [Methylobacterium radiotolerans]|jgi:AbrB family looped-hinge helix DNA binding protein|nr:AbrB family transcriptional regulator [Methylobacterium radiotolerans]
MASQAVKIIDGGKLIIPAPFRRKLGIDTGDTVVVELGEDGLHVRSLSSAVRMAQSIIAEFVPANVGLVDELIADRRAGAERE